MITAAQWETLAQTEKNPSLPGIFKHKLAERENNLDIGSILVCIHYVLIYFFICLLHMLPIIDY